MKANAFELDAGERVGGPQAQNGRSGMDFPPGGPGATGPGAAKSSRSIAAISKVRFGGVTNAGLRRSSERARRQN